METVRDVQIPQITDLEGKVVGYVELIDSMGDDFTVVNAARVSYLGESKGKEKDIRLLKYLMKHNHDSPFEMVQFTFKLHMPLPIAVQTLRHRTFSFNSASRRYTEENLEFYLPQRWRLQAEDSKQASVDEYLDDVDTKSLNRALKARMMDTIELYNHMVDDLKIAKEEARLILPQNMMVRMWMRCDLRNLLHFIALRNSPHAQYEMQLYAQAIEKIIEPIVPNSLAAFKEYRTSGY